MNIRRLCRPAALLAAASLASASLHFLPQEPAAQQEPKMTDAVKEKKVRELLDLIQASQMGKEAMEQMLEVFRGMPDLTEGFIDKFKEMAKPEELVELIVPIYVKQIDARDLDPLLAFFRTDSGKRWVVAQKSIMKESVVAGQEWGRNLATKVMTALKDGK